MAVSLYQQLALPLRFDQTCSFDHFYSADNFASHSIKQHINSTIEPLLLINGGVSTGKSHLLNASALYCQSHNVSFQYFDAEMLLESGVEVISECSKGNVLIIDNVHYLAQNNEWERKLYDLYNDAQRNHWLMIMSSTSVELNVFTLKDWGSRLKSAVHIGLTNATEAELKNIIQFRSKLLGLKIKPDVIDYLLVHFSRDLAVQIKLLQTLDKKALEQHRNITIPFIKKTLML